MKPKATKPNGGRRDVERAQRSDSVEVDRGGVAPDEGGVETDAPKHVSSHGRGGARDNERPHPLDHDAKKKERTV